MPENGIKAAATASPSLSPAAAPSAKSPSAPPSPPELYSSWYSFITFSWLTPLLKLGARKILENEDLYTIDPYFKVHDLTDEFERLWKARSLRSSGENHDPSPSTLPKEKKDTALIRSVLITLFARRFLPMGLYKLLADVSLSVNPLLLQYFLVFLGSPQYYTQSYVGYCYAVGLFLLAMIGSWGVAFYFQRVGGIGMSVRAVLTCAIYRKAFRLNTISRRKFDSGKIVNMISTDCVRLDFFTIFFHLAWCYAIMVPVLIALLIYIIGLSALTGVGLLILLIPLQTYITSTLVRIRKSNAVVTDSRIKLVQEILQGIRIVKLFAWEEPFYDRVAGIRETEVKSVFAGNLMRSLLTALGFSIPVLAASITFIVYAIISPVFNTAVVFSCMALFNQLRNPLIWTPQVIAAYADALVALTRIQEFLLAPESDFIPTITNDIPEAIVVQNGEFAWDSTPILKEINLSVPRGYLCAIVGKVGSGKSSLLVALLGQMQTNAGCSIAFSGTIGYCSQQAWIMNCSVRDNILFGLPYIKEKYDRIVKQCSLLADFKQFPAGDETEIGEKGVNLSGGQKQRVSLARLCYFDSDIVLLDDPLSAVDAAVGRSIFEDCIMGALKDKTVLLVTHQLHLIGKCDYIYVMDEGRISDHGSFADLMERGGQFRELIERYGQMEENEEEILDENSFLSSTAEPIYISSKSMKSDLCRSSGKRSTKSSVLSRPPEKESIQQQLMMREERAVGALSSKVLWSYGLACGGFYFMLLMGFAIIITQATRLATDFWLTVWLNNQVQSFSVHDYLHVYIGLSLAQTLTTFVFACLFAIGGVKAAISLHSNALRSLLACPILFFDTTPLGRIINRLSRDQDAVDNTLTDALRLFSFTFATAVGVLLLVIVITHGYILAVLVPSFIVYYYVQMLFRKSARELKRLDSISRSPLYASISETLTGVITIKAYNVETRFRLRVESQIDFNNRPFYLQMTAQRWLGLRLETIGNLLLLAVCFIGMLAGQTLSSSVIGLSLSYIMQVTGLLNLTIRQFSDSEVQLNSVERLGYYATSLEAEERDVSALMKCPHEWPSQGRIEFSDVHMRYDKHLPFTLKGVSLVIEPKSKVGIVGRTGSGKSSLLNALFRMADVPQGHILIDGVDCAKISVKDLRSRIAIIPQDPVLFSGTIRSNMDPFYQKTDDDIWLALEQSGLKALVESMPERLEYPVQSYGENFSVGERQLLCLCRALLKRSTIIVLDECTANVDLHSDNIIQASIRASFGNTTVLTIAHRLATIMDYDRILVMDNGSIAEYDSPSNLLAKPSSIFKDMVYQNGEEYAATLKSMISNP